MKILSPTMHGVVDYATVLLFLAAPTVFELTGVGALISYGLAAVHLALTLATAFPLGIGDLVPLSVHGLVELVVAIVLFLLGFLGLGIEQGGGMFYMTMGVVIFLVWLLTDYGDPHPAP